MFCGKCGAENQDNAEFCTNCGAKLNKGVKTNTVAVSLPNKNNKDRKVGMIAVWCASCQVDQAPVADERLYSNPYIQ